MAHIGQEFGFVAVGLFQFFGLLPQLLLGAQQIDVLFAHGDLLFFQGVGALFQLGVGRVQLFLLGLQFGLGFLEGAGLFFQLFVGDL